MIASSIQGRRLELFTLRPTFLTRLLTPLLVLATSWVAHTSTWAQETPATAPQWRGGQATQVARTEQPHTTRYTSGLDVLPNTAGQVWRTYDISSYTSLHDPNTRPERQIVDWILRETGTDIWFGDPLGILSATKTELRVYHTPEVQQVVHDMIDRFTDAGNFKQELTIRLVTVSSPNWRSRAFPLMTQIDLETPGIQAWLVSKENAALLLGDLRKRGDFVEHQVPDLLIPNGQSRSISRTQPVTYARSLRRDTSGWLLPTVEMGRFNEGYTLELSPLYASSGAVTEAVIKADVHQVEKLQPVNIDIPLPTGRAQRVQIQIPQLSSWSLHERFRWPTDQVLLLSCGVVAAPGPEPNGIIGLAKMLDTSSPRADALLFVESVRAEDRELYSGAVGQPRAIQNR